MAGHGDLTKDVDIDIQALFSNIWKKKWLILVLSFLAGIAIFMVMNSISPRYNTSAQLIIEPRESQFTRVQQTNGGINANEFDAAAVLSQVQIILSDEIALRTIRKLKLADVSEFRNEKKPSILSDLLLLAGVNSNPLEITPDERVLKAFKERLRVYSIERSRVIEILFWSNDRKLARDITNTIADEYLELQRKSKLETDINATKFLEPEIAALRDKVRTAEAKVAEFRANSDILIGSNNALLATQQLSEISTELSRIRGQRSAAKAKVESVRANLDIGASLEAIPEVVASPLIQRLRERQVQLRARISELSTTLLPAHPRLKAIKSQVSDFENQIRREARGILKSLENNVVIAGKQEASLILELDRLKAEAARAGEAEVELRAKEREAISERELLQAYMTKFREAAGRQNSKYIPINARIISGAHLPTESYFPKTIPYTIAGMVVTAILSMVGILVVSMLNGTALRSVETLAPVVNSNEDFIATNAVAQTSTVKNSGTDNQSPHDKSVGVSADEGFTSPDAATVSVSLTAEGLLGMGNAHIAVVSPGGDEGSITTWLLARKLAGANKTVAIMDMTGSGVTTAQMLGDANMNGVRDVLAGTAQIADVIFRDPLSTARLLPVGVTQPQDLLNAVDKLTNLVSALTTNFDYLIVDCGYATVGDLAHMADSDTVVLVSTIGDAELAAKLEVELIEAGYVETIRVHPNREEMLTLSSIAA